MPIIAKVDVMAEVKVKSRKQQSDREASLLLLAGLCICGYFKLSEQLYAIFMLGVIGKGAVLATGLSKEYDMKAKMAVKTEGAA